MDSRFLRNDGHLHPNVIPAKAGIQTSYPELLRSCGYSNFSISPGLSLRAKRSNLFHSKEIASSLRLLAMTGGAKDSVLPVLSV